jgi:hypothetical protein
MIVFHYIGVKIDSACLLIMIHNHVFIILFDNGGFSFLLLRNYGGWSQTFMENDSVCIVRQGNSDRLEVVVLAREEVLPHVVQDIG